MGTLLALVVLACFATISHSAHLPITVDKTLSGLGVPTSPAFFNVTTDNDYLTVRFTAPYSSGADTSAHLFLANDENRISELRFTPSGTTLVMSWAPYNPIRQMTWTDSSVKTPEAAGAATWSGSARVHRDYLPPRMNRYNAAAVYPKSDAELQYDTLYSITNFGLALPDLMVLPRYMEIGPRFLFDNDYGYSDQWSTVI